jgi:hypothetical protein
MEDESLEFRKIEDRCKELRAWILSNAPQCVTEEKHLVEGSQERAYWAHGYLTGLLDVMRLFSRDISGSRYNGGETPRSRHAA